MGGGSGPDTASAAAPATGTEEGSPTAGEESGGEGSAPGEGPGSEAEGSDSDGVEGSEGGEGEEGPDEEGGVSSPPEGVSGESPEGVEEESGVPEGTAGEGGGLGRHGGLEILDALTGVPRPEDVLEFAVQVCAPYSCLASYKWRLKLIPGSQKKGKAAREVSSVVVFAIIVYPSCHVLCMPVASGLRVGPGMCRNCHADVSTHASMNLCNVLQQPPQV